jgi:hypothetical protein
VILSAIQPETVANRFVIGRDHHADNWAALFCRMWIKPLSFIHFKV